MEMLTKKQQAKESILIWGASGHALIVADIIEAEGRFRLAGFIEDDSPTSEKYAKAGTVIGDRSVLEVQREAGVTHVIIGIGNSSARTRLAAIAEEKGFAFATAIHPRATVSQSAVVQDGAVICAGAVIGARAVVGKHAIVNTGASVDHECVVGEGAHIGPGAHLGGRVSVGKGAWIGIGATVRDNLVVGDGSIIGAGAVAVADVPAGKVVVGVPATVVRNVRENEV